MSRVAQLDAHLLDDELLSQLSGQLANYTEELTLVLKLLLYKLTVGNNHQSYGMFLMNLKYKGFTPGKKYAYLLWLVLGKYTRDKLSSVMYDEESWRSQVYSRLERAYSFVDTVNFLVFLVRGNYPNLMMRLLGIKMSYNSLELASQKGNVSYEFQNRQLVWNTFLEFILFILPIMQTSQLNSIFTRLLAPPTRAFDALEYKHLKERECAICFETLSKRQRIVSPVEASCGCKYCYVCLVKKLDTTAEEGWRCLRCGETVEYAVPYVDLDERAITCELEDDDYGEEASEAGEEEREHYDEKDHLGQRLEEDDEDEDRSDRSELDFEDVEDVEDVEDMDDDDDDDDDDDVGDTDL